MVWQGVVCQPDNVIGEEQVTQEPLKWERTGQPLILGNRLASGGEGSIFEISQAARQVAKIYSKPTTERAAKLQAMIASPPSNPTYHQGHVSIAWPTDRILNVIPSCVGFVMPRIDPAHSVPLLKLYHPADRQQTAPGFTWLYLIRTASNLASSIAALHAGGYVVGDLNESNVLVTDTALTTLVDCDSMQVPAAGKIFRCTVGKPDYTPPELQGLDFSQFDRTSHHDDFALAVLIFLLLMEGVHPFDGVWHGGGLDPTREQKIRTGAWPYTDANSNSVTPPPLALSFGILPMRLQGLMKRCFVDGARNPAMRPQASEWHVALRDTEQHLQRCGTNPQHLYSQHLSACPWCARMAQYHVPDPFPLVQQPLQPIGIVITPARPTIPLSQAAPVTQPASFAAPSPQAPQLHQAATTVPPVASQPPYGYSPQNYGQTGSYPPNYGQNPSYPNQLGYPQQGAYGQPYAAPVAQPQQGGGMAIAALVLGIISLIAWLFPICGLPIPILGLILGFIGRRSPARRTIATIGIVLSILGLVLGLGFFVLGVYTAIQNPDLLATPTVAP